MLRSASDSKIMISLGNNSIPRSSTSGYLMQKKIDIHINTYECAHIFSTLKGPWLEKLLVNGNTMRCICTIQQYLPINKNAYIIYYIMDFKALKKIN